MWNRVLTIFLLYHFKDLQGCYLFLVLTIFYIFFPLPSKIDLLFGNLHLLPKHLAVFLHKSISCFWLCSSCSVHCLVWTLLWSFIVSRLLAICGAFQGFSSFYRPILLHRYIFIYLHWLVSKGGTPAVLLAENILGVIPVGVNGIITTTSAILQEIISLLFSWESYLVSVWRDSLLLFQGPSWNSNNQINFWKAAWLGRRRRSHRLFFSSPLGSY